MALTTAIQALPTIILASTSPYRARLLEQIGINFTAAAPEFVERDHRSSPPEQTARQFAEEKARSLSPQYPNSLIIGSDQTASLENHILTKPGSVENACRQLQACSGKTVLFHTGLAVLNSQSGRLQLSVDTTTVKFRNLSSEAIERYITKELPLDCCGSFKIEGLGITLFESINGKDPNSLIGLPLIDLISALKQEGLEIP